MENFALPTVTPLQLRDILYTLLLAWKTSDDFIPWLIVYGMTGVGKSEILGNLLENFSRLAKVPILSIYPIITKEGEAVTLQPPESLTKTAAEVVIFVDGIGFMSPALLTKMMSGLLASVKFRKVFVIAASNLPHESAGGIQVQPPIPPAMARFVVLHVVPDASEYLRYWDETQSGERAELMSVMNKRFKREAQSSFFSAALEKLQSNEFKDMLINVFKNPPDEELREAAGKALEGKSAPSQGDLRLFDSPQNPLQQRANIAYDAIIKLMDNLNSVIEGGKIPDNLPQLPTTKLLDTTTKGVRAAFYDYSLKITDTVIEKCADIILKKLYEELEEQGDALAVSSIIGQIRIATNANYIKTDAYETIEKAEEIAKTTGTLRGGFGYEPTLYEEHVSLLERIRIKEDFLEYSALNPKEVENFLQQLKEIWERDPELGRALDAITEANLSITSFKYILSLVTAFSLIKRKEGKVTLRNVGKETEKTEVQKYLDKILYPIVASMLGGVGIKIYREKLRELLSDTRMLSLPPIESFVTFLNRIRGAEAETLPPATQEFDPQFQV